MGMTAAEILRKEGYDQAMLFMERLKKEGYDQGICEGLLEGIELGLSIRFGEKGVEMMSRIRKIQDIGRLKALKEIIKTAPTAEDLKKIISD